MQTINIVIHVFGPDASSITFTLAPGPLVVPVPRGTVLGALTVQPAGWQGALTLSGADAGLIGIDGSNNLVALAEMTQIRDYPVTVAAAP